MTKVHEQLVRGPISAVAAATFSTTGEFTLVLDIGQITDNIVAARPSDSATLSELGYMTAHEGVSRRRAINLIARKYNIPPNEVYAAIERAKKLVD
jgi:16S rRNA C1402 (ribose-2'-O) methylase RsmI